MKAITTKYLGPTDTRGSRIKADDGDGNTATVPYPHHLSNEHAHFEAVKALCERLNWHGNLAWGGLRTGYVFVWCDGGPLTISAEVAA